METKCCGTCKRWLYVHPIEDYICDKRRGGAHQGQPAGGNGESVMDWTTLDINTPAERDVVCMVLCHAGYTVRQRRRKDGNKTVIIIEHRREGNA